MYVPVRVRILVHVPVHVPVLCMCTCMCSNGVISRTGPKCPSAFYYRLHDFG